MTGPTTVRATTVQATALRDFTRDVFTAAGFSDAHAGTIAEVLVWANLRGVDSHGVQRIPRYLELIDEGNLNPEPDIRVRLETPAAVMIDADRGPGPVAMILAAREAARKAKEAAIGLALVRRTTHTAAMGYYTRLAAQAGVAAIAGAASIPNMAYYGTRVPGVSTSAFSLAVPNGEAEPLVFDMATSVASLGKMAAARKTGQSLPAGWAIDTAGNPTTDPLQAALALPLGGAKGAGIALMFECIASLVAGNPILAETIGKPAPQHRQNAFLIAIDIARFGDPSIFAAQVGLLVQGLKSLPRQPGFDEILMPGERGARTLAKRSQTGIPIPPGIWKDLGAAAARFGVKLPEAVA